MGALLRPKGAAFPKNKAVRVREEARASLGAKVLSDSLELGPGERWFVARVLTHQENRAQFNLHRLGFRNFLPRLRRTVRHARKLRDTLNPLFPGYIFVIIDLSKHRWRSINGTFGVASLIMGGDQPMPVPPHVVEALVASCESHGVVRLDDGLEIGQKVRILSGPFAETLCRLARLDDRGRVHVLLEIMGMEVAAQLDRFAIAPAAFAIVKGEVGQSNHKLGGHKAAAVSGSMSRVFSTFMDNVAHPSLSGDLSRYAGKNKDRHSALSISVEK